MLKGIVTAVCLAFALTGCGAGPAGDLGENAKTVTYKFAAKVAVNPTAPMPSQRVLLNLEVTSASTRAVKTDIYLSVVSSEGETMYESVWEDVYFHENEVWNLTQGFLANADAAKKAWSVKILVHNKENDLPLFDQSIGTLEFGKK